MLSLVPTAWNCTLSGRGLVVWYLLNDWVQMYKIELNSIGQNNSAVCVDQLVPLEFQYRSNFASS